MKTQTEKRKVKESNVTPLPVKKEKAADHTFCGPHMKLPPMPVVEDVPLADRMLHAGLGKISGLSPASLGLAYADWLTHLALSPGRQAELARSAADRAALFASFIRCQVLGHDHEECCAEPLPQDRRFKEEDITINYPVRTLQFPDGFKPESLGETTMTAERPTRHPRSTQGPRGSAEGPDIGGVPPGGGEGPPGGPDGPG